MKPALVFLILAVFNGLPVRSQTTTNGKAQATGTCSVAHSGNNDTFYITNCGIGAEQGEKIVELLNKVLAGQDTASIDAKLDRLLQLVNPYAGVTTYDPSGRRRTRNESTGVESFDDGGAMYMRLMQERSNANDWAGLADLSRKAIQQFPGWFTPFALLGEAQMLMCQTDEAKASFARYIADTEGADSFSPGRAKAKQSLESLSSSEYKTNCTLRKH